MNQLLADRRALHQIPELDDRLPKTTAYLRSVLCSLHCDLTEPIPGAVCAFFDFGKENAIAFRSDADALPILEQTGLPFASQIPGQMHACGHDGHMAMLLSLARWLDAQAELAQNVLLVFQPSEETTGGAKRVCQSGIFEKYHVKAIFGMHLWPGLAAGEIASRREEMMSRSCEVTIELTGKSSHIASAHNGIDAMAAGVAVYQRCMEMERTIAPQFFRLLKFGKFQSGTVRNAISGFTRIEGSLRAFQDDVFEKMQREIRRICEQTAEETGCKIEVTMNDGYPAVMNPPALYDRVRKVVTFTELPKPVMITEDFSWYQRSLPGMFFFLGTGSTPALHAANFQFDETILEKGAVLWRQLAAENWEDICSNI